MSKPLKLTNDTVRTLPAKVSGDAIYADSDSKNGVPGLYLRVRAGGSRTFVIQWRQGKVQRRSTVGKVGVLTLDEARKAARKLLVGIDDGKDPIAAKAKTRADDKQLFETVAQEYLDARTDMKPLSLAQCKLHLKTYFKGFNRLPVGKIDRPVIAAELRTIVKERGPVAADRSRSTLSSFFGWCIGEGYAEANPVVGTNKASTGEARDRVLSDAELVQIWNGAPDSDYGRIVKLLMLTGQRRDEIAAMTWDELTLSEAAGESLIALPKERTKNSRPHDVPLSAPAIAILGGVKRRDDRDNVFGQGEGGFSGYSRAKVSLDKAAQLGADWTLHDLRRTMATRMADLGVLPHVIEAILNHVSGHKSGVAGIYNRSTYANEKRAALDLWGTHVMAMLARASGANVTVLRKAWSVLFSQKGAISGGPMTGSPHAHRRLDCSAARNCRGCRLARIRYRSTSQAGTKPRPWNRHGYGVRIHCDRQYRCHSRQAVSVARFQSRP